MINFYELILDVLDEKGKSIKDLEREQILGKNTIYLFSSASPSLSSLIKIANYLEVSIDYIIYQKDINNFQPYEVSQAGFFEKLEQIRLDAGISQSKLCADLNISRTNFSRWKHGTTPSIYKLIELAEYLNCDIDDLLVHTGENFSEN